MSLAVKSSPLGTLNQKFTSFQNVGFWLNENPTTVKTLTIAGVILGIGLLASFPFPAPALGLGCCTGAFLMFAFYSYASYFPPCSFDLPCEEAKQHTMKVKDMVEKYFLAKYQDNPSTEKRKIAGQEYVVERPNHGLAHSLRQGALAKDIFNLLVKYLAQDSSGICDWALKKKQSDPEWIKKIEMAASFQRSGRQKECRSIDDPVSYNRYETQDAKNFTQDAKACDLFENDFERSIFAEAILWSVKGELNEDKIKDLKYLRRILHAAHTLDLRRMHSFDGERIRNDAMEQLFGKESNFPYIETFKQLLWNRSGDYLSATGDRDLVDVRGYQDKFFLQSHDPCQLVNAIYDITSTNANMSTFLSTLRTRIFLDP
jgi:hypothetical protein